MYQVAKTGKKKRFRKLKALIILLLIGGLSYGGYAYAKNWLKPETTIKQAKATTATISYDAKTRKYNEADFTIEIPIDWQPVARPAGPYQTFTWATHEGGTNGQQIQIFEDVIPVNFAVNRAVIISGQTDHITVEGQASDNCSAYTNGQSTTPGQVGAPAKWQNVDFLCDQANTQRDVIGTSSKDGVNTVILKNQQTGQLHKFFFTFTANGLNPDYTVFTKAIQSFAMQ